MIETALSQVVGIHVPVIGSGRTDAAAHALNQVIAFSADTRLSSETICKALNANLPDDIAITSIREVADGFNPRKDALSRTYRYQIWNRPVRSPFLKHRATHVARVLDAGAMHAAAQFLIGRHDLSSFIPVQQDGNRERTIFDARCWREGHMVLIQLEATGFMRQMVRAIAGTLIRVGVGKMTPAEFADVLRSRNRDCGGDTAPADGLYLIRVKYPTFIVESDDRVAVECSAALYGRERAQAATNPVATRDDHTSSGNVAQSQENS